MDGSAEEERHPEGKRLGLLDASGVASCGVRLRNEALFE